MDQVCQKPLTKFRLPVRKPSYPVSCCKVYVMTEKATSDPLAFSCSN